MIDDCSGCDKVSSVVFLTGIEKNGTAILLCDKCLKEKDAVQKKLNHPFKKISLKKYRWLEVV